MKRIDAKVKVQKVRHALDKDASPWCIAIKIKSKTFGKIACDFTECFGFDNHKLIVMGRLKSTPILSSHFKSVLKRELQMPIHRKEDAMILVELC